MCEEERYRHCAPQLLRDTDQSFLEMNTEQCNIFGQILDSVHTYASERSPNFPLFFLEGKPGQGKTFVVNAICNQLRGENHIVLVVGSSALAATLYDGGQTAHNLFQIPVTEVRIVKL